MFQHVLLSSVCYYCPILSSNQKMGDTYTPKVMESSSTLHILQLRQKCRKYSSGRCYLQMILPWLLIMRKLYNSSDASHTESFINSFNIINQDISNIPNTSIGDYTLELVEDFTYLMFNISSNLYWDAMLNIQIGKTATARACLAKRFGATSCCQSTPRWNCIQPVCSVCYFIAMRHEPCDPSRNADTITSICAGLEGFWASLGSTMLQTRTFW